jgi:hypothetical protein
MHFFKPAKPADPPPDGARKSPAPAIARDLRFDPLPQPEVIESDSDTSWDLWQDSVNPHEEDSQSYQDTEPLGLTPESAPKKPQRSSS